MKKIVKIFLDIVTYPFKILSIFLIYLYKILISPIFPKSCIYLPTCSKYGILAIKRFGIVKGFFLTFKRICRCTPHRKGGLDPVPDNIKGNVKWIV